VKWAGHHILRVVGLRNVQRFREIAVTVRVRIAPSPTGNLHIGTARTAVFNWLYARHQEGQFILRVEDTDLERSRTEYTQNILDGLTWLGIDWEVGPIFQSQRLDYYRQMIQKLLDQGLAYRCYCTEAELNQMREEQKANKQAPRYDNRHRHLSQEQRDAFEAEGRTYVIRFIIDDEREITWNDLVRGQVTWRGSDLGGDMVVARAAAGTEIGQPLYNLAVVADDIDMGITHVIRGEDHIGNTPKQILLYEALGAEVPTFAHTPLILNKEGQKLSKRDGVTSISDFRDMGYVAPALVNYMTLLGWSPPDNEEIFTLTEVAEKFSFDRVNKAGAKFDWDKLNWLNGQYLHQMPAEKLTDELIPYWQGAGYEFDPVADRAWLEQLAALIGPSLTRLQEAVEMCRVFFAKTVTLSEESAGQLEQEGVTQTLEAILEGLKYDQPFTEIEAQELLKQVTKSQKLKKGMVMRSLRAALTGEVHGPDLVQSWVLLHAKALDKARLQTVLGIEEQQETLVSETPMPEKPTVEPEQPEVEPPASATVTETPVTAPPAPTPVTPPSAELNEQFEQIKQQVGTLLADLPENLSSFFTQYKSLLVTLGVVFGALVGLRLLQAILDVFDSIPLLGGLFELIGMGYTGWFIFRYLLRAEGRQRLNHQVQSFKEQIAGQNSSNQS
jgi:glutamyl-tRNA synthetase